MFYEYAGYVVAAATADAVVSIENMDKRMLI